MWRWIVANLGLILGQAGAVGALRSALASGRLAHGLLFSGPEGVGKGTTAEALGRVFLCDKPSGLDGRAGEVDSCGVCASCKLMDADGRDDGGTHPDYHRVYRQLVRLKKDSVARDLGVDVIRDYVVAPAGRSSQLGRGKVFVIEEADAMNTTAQNALLKTLEEPPGRTLIVLLAGSEGSLLPTIRSRCQPVRFAPLAAELVVGELVRRGMDEGEAKEAARLADGSLGEAIRFSGDGLLTVAKELETRLTACLTGRSDGELAKFMKTAGEGLAEKVLERDPDGSKDQATRDSLGLLLRLGESSLRRLLRVARTTGGLEKLCGGIDSLTAARVNLEGNVNVNLALQQLMAELEG